MNLRLQVEILAFSLDNKNFVQFEKACYNLFVVLVPTN